VDLEQLGVVFDERIGGLGELLRDGAAKLATSLLEKFLLAEFWLTIVGHALLRGDLAATDGRHS